MTAPNHLKKHVRAASKADTIISEQFSTIDSEATPATKRARSDGAMASMGNFIASAAQSFVFLKKRCYRKAAVARTMRRS